LGHGMRPLRDDDTQTRFRSRYHHLHFSEPTEKLIFQTAYKEYILSECSH
jgi:hypothetical protein